MLVPDNAVNSPPSGLVTALVSYPIYSFYMIMMYILFDKTFSNKRKFICIATQWILYNQF